MKQTLFYSQAPKASEKKEPSQDLERLIQSILYTILDSSPAPRRYFETLIVRNGTTAGNDPGRTGLKRLRKEIQVSCGDLIGILEHKGRSKQQTSRRLTAWLRRTFTDFTALIEALSRRVTVFETELDRFAFEAMFIDKIRLRKIETLARKKGWHPELVHKRIDRLIILASRALAKSTEG